MKSLKNIISWIFILLISYQYFLSSCAQVASPPGGDKDTIPPSIINSYPKNQALNFKDNKIILEFDEYIKTNNLRTELLVTPSIGFYETKIKPTSVELILDSALKDSTTYTFNFRNGIEDATERNKGINIKIVFSTSNEIDSLSIKGNVKNLFTDKKIEKAIVGLYPYNDSLRIDKVKPYYFTQTDTSGNFHLENLAWGKYYLAAFTDKNGNLIYNPNEEIVDFITDQYIDLDTNQKTYTFKLANSNLDSIKLGKTTVNAKSIQFDFKKNYKEFIVLNKDSLGLAFQGLKNNSILFFNSNQGRVDTLISKIKIIDSLDRDTILNLPIYFRESIEKKEKEKAAFSFTIDPGNKRKLNPNDSLILNFPLPFVSFNPDSILFFEDSLNYQSYSKENFKINYDQTKLVIPNEIFPKKKKFWIDFRANSFINIYGDSTSAGILKLEYEDPQVYGIIRGQIARPVEGFQYIVQLLDAKTQKLAYQIITERQFAFETTLPNTYIIRVIEDSNKNGYWDQGNYLEKKKPEKIIFYPNEIKLKSYFEITDIIINN